MNTRLIVLGLGVGVVGALYALSRTKAGGAIASDFLEEVVVTTKKVADAVYTVAWKESANAAKYLPYIASVEKSSGIPVDLLARQAYQESHFRDDIVSGKKVSSAGALGIMQIVPKWHPGVNPLDWQASVKYAAGYLKQLRGQFGTWSLALAAYNAGPGNVTKYGNKIPPFVETQNYVAQIIGDAKASNPNTSPEYYA